jgi:ribosomal protein L11 methyltransferase
VKVARENAERNGVLDRIEVHLTPQPPSLKGRGSGDEASVSPLPFREGGPGGLGADLAVANITASAVAGLATTFAAALRPEGRLIGSGIVGDRLEDVLEALRAAGFTIDEVREGGDWRAVLATNATHQTSDLGSRTSD